MVGGIAWPQLNSVVKKGPTQGLPDGLMPPLQIDSRGGIYQLQGWS